MEATACPRLGVGWCSLSERDAEFARREALWEQVRSRISKDFKASDNLSREELYDRAAARAEADEARDRTLHALRGLARTLGCEVVLSEDLSDGQDYGGVRVENPFSDC